ncbi:hypothetical protein [Spirosoma sordidisoli]|nr:hypothetical protein [Spirosoma sordidisoli]
METYPQVSPSAAAAAALVNPSQSHYQPGDVPAFVSQHREAIATDPFAVAEGEWCRISGLPCTREQLYKLLAILFRGEKADLFFKKFKAPFTDFVDCFVNERAINNTFKDRSQVFRFFNLYATDKQVELVKASQPSYSHRIDFGSYEYK